MLAGKIPEVDTKKIVQKRFFTLSLIDLGRSHGRSKNGSVDLRLYFFLILVSKPGNEEIVVHYRQENAQANGAD